MKKIIFLIAVLNLVSLNAQVKEYFITCDTTEFENIYKHPRENIYIPITLTHEGETWDDVDMRIRGDDTRDHPKKSLKLKFGDKPFANGRFRINFNAEYQDESYICQFMASMTYRKLGYPCYETEFAKLYLNGEYFGLYLRIENMDEQFLERVGLDPNGNLYKATEDDASLSIYDKLDSLWEKKTNEDADWQDLFDLRDSLFYVKDEDYFEFSKKIFDYDNMITAIATNMLLSNGSTYYHNYYMYHDINGSGKWMYLPWDMDKTFFRYGYTYDYVRSSSHYSPDNPFLERALICEPIFEDIRIRVDEIVNEFFDNDFYDPVIDSLYLLINEAVEADSTDLIEDMQVWIEALEKNKKYVRKRYDVLDWQFNTYPRSFKVEPTLGEYFLPIEFKWHPSFSPNGRELIYNFYIGERQNLNEVYSFRIDSLKDTTLLFDEELEPGMYYWKVEAENHSVNVDGYNYPNQIIIKAKNPIPCHVTERTVLTKEDSPYYVDCEVIVEAPLIIEEGVSIYMEENKKIIVKDSLIISGSEEEKVKIKPYGDYALDQIYIEDGYLNMNHCVLQDMIIYSKNSAIYLDNSELFPMFHELSEHHAYVTLDKGYIEVDNSSFKTNGQCEGVRVLNADYSKVINCRFDSIPDAIEFINVEKGEISFNRIINPTNDGIDINNCDSMIIEGNLIAYAADKGISIGNEGVGASNETLVKRNILAHCHIGVAVKDSSSAEIINNTVYKCRDGLLTYQKIVGAFGGHSIMKNNIVSQCEYPIVIDYLSTGEITYCLSDDSLFAGEGNIYASPKFKDPDNLNFNLRENSPCIDSGDPYSEKDYDGSRNDIGALPFGIDQLKPAIPKIVINEINYNSSDEYDSGDWIELYNNDTLDVDISGWIFKDDNNLHKYEIQENTILDKGEYIVIYRYEELFENIFPDVENAIGEFEFGLSGSGDEVRIYNRDTVLVDSVAYGTEEPWSTKADGNGSSLELILSDYDNTLADNWKASINNGTPGEANSVIIDTPIIEKAKELFVFPNPAEDFIIIDFAEKSFSPDGIQIVNLLGEDMSGLLSFNNSINGQKINISKLVPGLYFIRFEDGSQLSFVKN